MKKMRKHLGLLVIAMLLLALPITASAAVKLNKKSLTLAKGQQYYLRCSGTTAKVTWKSSNKKVASVYDGTITAKAKGTAKITAKVKGKKLTCKVKVEAPVINKTYLNLTTGGSYKLKVSKTSQKVKWSSNNTSVATVTSKGVVRGVGTGTAIITARLSSGMEYTCLIDIPALNDSTIDSSISKVYVLKEGYYTAGIDIPAGVFDAVGIAGCGYIIGDSTGVNIKGKDYDDQDSYTTTFRNFTLKKGEVLEVRGVEVQLTYNVFYSGFTGRTYDTSRSFTLTPGYYIVGRDLAAGRYCVKYVSGGGGYVSSDRWEGTGILNANMDGDPETGVYCDYVSNVILTTGETIEVTSGLTVMFIPEK